MVDKRRANESWNLVTTDNCYQLDQHYRLASLAVLMDIRDQLQRLNGLLGCSNFMGIPRDLRQIRKNTTKRKYVRKAAAA